MEDTKRGIIRRFREFLSRREPQPKDFVKCFECGSRVKRENAVLMEMYTGGKIKNLWLCTRCASQGSPRSRKVDVDDPYRNREADEAIFRELSGDWLRHKERGKRK